MYKAFISIFFLLIFSSFAQAQSSIPKVELFTGYSNLNSEFGNSLNGVTTSVSGQLTKSVSAVADISFYSKNGSNATLLLFGPRYSVRTNSRFTPYFHALFGGVAPIGTFAMNFGGGVDYKVNKNISLRLIQADYVQFRNGAGTLNNSRISTGIVFTFGNKE